jgi:hypothetical protein
MSSSSSVSSSTSSNKSSSVIDVEKIRGPTHRESSLKKNEKRVHLGSDFVPGEGHVICGRGKVCTCSPGNKKLRAIIESFAISYDTAAAKEHKSQLVSNIIDLIKRDGAFVKFEEKTWWEVDDCYAREKIGYLLREVLTNKYRSSSKAKQDRKRRASLGMGSSSSSSSSTNKEKFNMTALREHQTKNMNMMMPSMAYSMGVSQQLPPIMSMDAGMFPFQAQHRGSLGLVSCASNYTPSMDRSNGSVRGFACTPPFFDRRHSTGGLMGECMTPQSDNFIRRRMASDACSTALNIVQSSPTSTMDNFFFGRSVVIPKQQQLQEQLYDAPNTIASSGFLHGDDESIVTISDDDDIIGSFDEDIAGGELADAFDLTVDRFL